MARSLTFAENRLLVLDVDRFRLQLQHLHRREQFVAFLRVVTEEQLESRELYRLTSDVRSVRVELQPRRAPTIHVDHDLYARVELDLIGATEHRPREAVHHEHLWWQLLLRDEIRELVDRPVH